ncbi:two-component system sensor histidine kinase YesM [Lachnotalea glycerini]|uniref:histidine kinase n=1 Tax=Lachnotalea glycerini TaxID=1763509 RepID=A0A318ENH7_9FIRM|nr:sensor histidine kinase [Lachnotalea glycerini]PXV87309.1 two-component system sensor histidine kinase YesM [Lachnotalea glycerini]
MNLLKCWKNHFNNFRLSQKMLFVYFLIFGAFSTISIAAMQTTLAIYDNKIYENSLQELFYFVNTIENELDNIEKSSSSIAIDYEIQKQLTNMMSMSNKQEYLLNMSSFRSQLLNEALGNESIMNIIYTDRNGVELNVGEKYVALPEDIYRTILEKADEAKGGFVYIEPTLEFPYLVSGRDIKEHIDYSLDYLGTLIFINDINVIFERNYEFLKSGQKNICVFSNNEIVYENDGEYFKDIPSITDEQGYRIINIKHKKYFMCYLKSEKTEWTFVNLFPYTNIFMLNSIIRMLMLVGFFVLFITAYFAMKKLSLYITAPLEKLTKSMQIIERGEFEQAKLYLDKVEALSEVGILKKDFLIMIDEVMTLIHENYEKQIILKDTQYRALQAQINPHFLYNTLNSINWMIKSNENEDASRMILSLGTLLRVALSSNTVSTVLEELELVEDYIFIQKFRYGKRVEFIIKKCSGLELFKIPSMSIQPLVENAIFYGVENSLQPCTIEIKLDKEEDYLNIIVSDNGMGMEDDLLEKVKNFQVKTTGNGIGLKNIKERLTLLFCEDFKLQIQSKIGEGTMIKMTIPTYRSDFNV